MAINISNVNKPLPPIDKIAQKWKCRRKNIAVSELSIQTDWINPSILRYLLGLFGKRGKSEAKKKLMTTLSYLFSCFAYKIF